MIFNQFYVSFFLHSFNHSFIYSFIHTFIYSYISGDATTWLWKTVDETVTISLDENIKEVVKKYRFCLSGEVSHKSLCELIYFYLLVYFCVFVFILFSCPSSNPGFNPLPETWLKTSVKIKAAQMYNPNC